MATERRLIDANALKDALRTTEGAKALGNSVYKLFCVDEIIDAQPTVDTVEVVQFNALKSLVNGEWVDCKLVEEALGIDFATGLKMFDFSRTAEWNPAPLNGQKITTKFRLKNAVVHGRWIWKDGCFHCSNCKTTNDHTPAYCEGCGAKMDGDGNG